MQKTIRLISIICLLMVINLSVGAQDTVFIAKSNKKIKLSEKDGLKGKNYAFAIHHYYNFPKLESLNSVLDSLGYPMIGTGFPESNPYDKNMLLLLEVTGTFDKAPRMGANAELLLSTNKKFTNKEFYIKYWHFGFGFNYVYHVVLRKYFNIRVFTGAFADVVTLKIGSIYAKELDFYVFVEENTTYKHMSYFTLNANAGIQADLLVISNNIFRVTFGIDGGIFIPFYHAKWNDDLYLSSNLNGGPKINPLGPYFGYHLGLEMTGIRKRIGW